MIQPRLGATWAYNGTDTVFASYARYNPAANSAAARRVVGPQPRRAAQRLLRRRTATCSASRRTRRRPASCSSGRHQAPPRSTSIWSAPAGSSPRWSARVYGRYRKGTTSGKTPTTTRASRFDAPAGIPHELYIPNLHGRRTSAHDPRRHRQRLDLRDRRARRRLHQVLRGDDGIGVARQQAVRQRLVHLEPLLRQLRPGQLLVSTANDADIFIGSSNIGDGAGRQLWDFKYGDLRGDRRNVVKMLRHLRPAVERAPSARSRVYQSASRTSSRASAVPAAHRLDERHRTATRSRPARAARRRITSWI